MNGKDDVIIITLQDMRKVKYCARGAKSFLAKHGLSWSDFLEKGIPSDRLEATGDAMALKVVEVARGRG